MFSIHFFTLFLWYYVFIMAGRQNNFTITISHMTKFFDLIDLWFYEILHYLVWMKPCIVMNEEVNHQLCES